MANRFIAEGQNLKVVPAGAVTINSIIVSGDCIGIVGDDAAAGEEYALLVEGVYSVPKVAGEAWVPGDSLGWDSSASAFDKTFTPGAGDVINAGVAYKAAASADVVGYIKLTPGAGTAQ